jgi:hypothetical protein
MADTITLLRPSDMLTLTFEVVGWEISEDRTRLIRTDPGALIVVRFPPQALAEENFPGLPPDSPIRTALAGESRLVFRPPDGDVPLTTAALLDWTDWEPVLAPTARLPRGSAPAPDIPPPAFASEFETSIEFPWRLTVSPDATSRWLTDTAATSSPREQLWSAVLAPVGEQPPGVSGPPRDIRALGAFRGPEPFAGLPTPENRRQIVQLTSNFHLPIPLPAGVGEYTPEPLAVRRLELTALGANADLEGSWSYPDVPEALRPPGFDPIGLRQYQHIAGLGRDTFARTVAVGWLCGSGHRAVVVTTVQRISTNPRVVANPPEGSLFTGTAYLLKTVDVIVQQPRLDYGPLGAAFGLEGRELPIRSILLTTTTAPVKAVAESEPAWLVNPDGTELRFHAIGTDVAGGTFEFALPLMFVPYEAISQHDAIRHQFDHPPEAIQNAHVIELSGQTISVAPAGDRPGSTGLTVTSLTYDIEQPLEGMNPHPGPAMKPTLAPSWYVPGWLPRIALLNASSPAIADLVGGAAPADLVLDDKYLNYGFHPEKNRAQTFVGFVASQPLALPSQRGGGLASPDAAVHALSRTLGPVASPDELQQGVVNLSAFADTRILGTIPLLSLLPPTPDMAFAAPGPVPPTEEQLDNPDFEVNPPRLTTRREPAGAVPDLIETRFIWKPPLRTEALLPLLTLDLEHADLLLDSQTRVVRGGESSAIARGRLRNVRLIFAGALSASIAELSFRAETGRKMEFGASKVEIGFLGPLTFVNALQSILPANGFDDPPYVTADGQGVVAGYTLAVPSIGVGIFSIQNIAVGAALSIPWTDRPAGVRFALCERHKPFLVTVSLFGGGGFFAVGVSANGLESVEASVEFGGNISLNLGVASGGVYVMAGVYFGMTGSSVELTGYLRCGGHLSVLGLISISLEFYLAFTYRDKKPGSEIWGQASLTVSVKVAFFSTSVTLSVERRFAGSDGDPSFADTVTPLDWVRYLEAYAA